jgi:glycosyltransferase involved in cell wall biosynthesis
MMKVDVTVALSVHNSERYIRACIESLLAQTFKNYEIVVVEDPPYDRTKRIIETFEDKRIVYLRNARARSASPIMTCIPCVKVLFVLMQ